MRAAIFFATVSLSALATFPSKAATDDFHPNYNPLKVEQLNVTTGGNGNKNKYKVDGVEIELTEKEKILAKNWSLSESDWAKYKYIMEFTPRGLWTPDLDPPIALGNMAKTPEERLYYARIMTNIEMSRRQREALMTEAGEFAAKEYANNGIIPQPKQPTGLAAVLTNNRNKLRSIFVDLRNCNQDCKVFLTLALSSSSSKTKVDMHFTGGDESEAKVLLKSIGVDEQVITRKAISISAQLHNPTIEKYRNGGTVPYYINKTDDKTFTKHM